MTPAEWKKLSVNDREHCRAAMNHIHRNPRYTLRIRPDPYSSLGIAVNYELVRRTDDIQPDNPNRCRYELTESGETLLAYLRLKD